jgi:hypothetical protein
MAENWERHHGIEMSSAVTPERVTLHGIEEVARHYGKPPMEYVIEWIHRIHQDGWQPIATAPVPPRETMMYGHWHCLLQSKGRVVHSGYAAYVQGKGRTVKTYHLQWYDDHHRVTAPVYWMPLPAPKEEPDAAKD